MNNINPLPLMGALIGLIALYYTHVQYKRKIFHKNELLGWGSVWAALVGISFISMFVIPLKQTIYIYSLLDLVVFLSIIGVYILLFTIHRRQNIIDERTKKLIREVTYKKADAEREG